MLPKAGSHPIRLRAEIQTSRVSLSLMQVHVVVLQEPLVLVVSILMAPATVWLCISRVINVCVER